MLTWQGTGGFSIDASVRIEGHDRQGLERLVRGHRRVALVVPVRRSPSIVSTPWGATRHCAHPMPDSSIGYRDPRPTAAPSSSCLPSNCSSAWPGSSLHHASIAIAITESLPQGTRRRWVARLRPQVIALRPSELTDPPLPGDDETQPSRAHGSHAAEGSPPSGRSARMRWTQLLARIYEVLPLLCTSCGGQMRILAFLTDPPVVRSILAHLDLPHRPPPLAPARGPPQGDFLLDQSLGSNPTAADPVPVFDFDQSLPDPVDG
jgi:hypothetical protein